MPLWSAQEITFITKVPISVLTDCRTKAAPRNYVNNLFIDCLRNAVSNTKSLYVWCGCFNKSFELLVLLF